MSTTHKERLNQLITALGLSKNKFAKAIGTSSAVVSNITTADVNYGVELAEKIISTFPMISPSWLLSGIGEMMLAEPHLKPHSEPHLNEDDGGPMARIETVDVYNRPRQEDTEETGPMKLIGPESIPNSAVEGEYDWLQHTRHSVEEVRQKTLQDHQNKLNYQLRREDKELFQFKDNLEHLGWVFEDAKRIMQELEIRYSATFFDTKKKMSYDLFKALAIRELKRRAKYSEAIKVFSEALNEFTSEVTVDKLWQDFKEDSGPLDGALAVAEEDAINASVRHPDIEEQIG